MRNYNHRKSSDKIWAQEGRLSGQKAVIFPSFSSVIMNFFSSIELIPFIDPLHAKNSESLMLEVAKVLKLTLFSVRSLKSLTPVFSQTACSVKVWCTKIARILRAVIQTGASLVVLYYFILVILHVIDLISG